MEAGNNVRLNNRFFKYDNMVCRWICSYENISCIDVIILCVLYCR